LTRKQKGVTKIGADVPQGLMMRQCSVQKVKSQRSWLGVRVRVRPLAYSARRTAAYYVATAGRRRSRCVSFR